MTKAHCIWCTSYCPYPLFGGHSCNPGSVVGTWSTSVHKRCRVIPSWTKPLASKVSLWPRRKCTDAARRPSSVPYLGRFLRAQGPRQHDHGRQNPHPYNPTRKSILSAGRGRQSWPVPLYCWKACSHKKSHSLAKGEVWAGLPATYSQEFQSCRHISTRSGRLVTFGRGFQLLGWPAKRSGMVSSSL